MPGFRRAIIGFVLLTFFRAPAHISLLVRKHLAKNNTALSLQAPDMTTFEFSPKTDETNEKTTLRYEWGNKHEVEGSTEKDRRTGFFKSFEDSCLKELFEQTSYVL